MRSNQRLRMAARSFAVLADQAGSARLAASMARVASLAPRSGTVATSAPVAGSKTGNMWFDVTHWPSIMAAAGNFLEIMVIGNLRQRSVIDTVIGQPHATCAYQR